MDLKKLKTLQRLPESGAVNPRLLRETERGQSLGMMLPGMNAGKKDGTDPKTWFRQIFNRELEKANVGGETFAETLHHLLGPNHKVDHCPNPDCSKENLSLPRPGQVDYCPTCGVEVLPTDGLRIHEQFRENESPTECHSRVRDTLEILALVNSLRYLVKSELGRVAIGNTAFVMDGQLAAFGTIAVLARAIRKELQDIQSVLNEKHPGALLLVMSGVKSGPFVNHAEELDRAPAPGQNIPRERLWLPDNDYIRANIVARHSDSPKPWGELTHYGRPIVMKTKNGQRLVLNIAQPEAEPPLTNALAPLALADAVNTAGPLGVGTDQFLALRRAHNRAAIPLRAGTDLIKSLAP
ncbi:MAG: hypothetical protein OXC09_05640 [Truepera sp.]|nr:hypothetical protein [Truepera sp.]